MDLEEMILKFYFKTEKIASPLMPVVIICLAPRFKPGTKIE